MPPVASEGAQDSGRSAGQLVGEKSFEYRLPSSVDEQGDLRLLYLSRRDELGCDPDGASSDRWGVDCIVESHSCR
jgi:hypothetical protein